MGNRVARTGIKAVVLACACSWGAMAASGQQQPGGGTPSGAIRDGFESARVAWRLETTDATVKIYAQERTKRAAHEGFQSEGFSFDAGVGGGFYYSYALPKIAVTNALRVSLFVRSNRAGAYFMARVILPADVDPESQRPSFVQIQSTSYDSSDRWQRLDLEDLVPEIERQARVLRAATRRKVSLEGAYLERLVVNLYGGEGETEVYLDELTIAPVAADVAAAFAEAGPGRPKAIAVADRPRGDDEALPPLPSSARVQFDRNRLTKDGYPWFFTAVRGLGLDPVRLKRSGFDVLFLPKGADRETVDAAAKSGLLLVPELVGEPGRNPLDPDQVVSEAATFPGRESVAFWSIGQDLGRELDLEPRKDALRRTRDTLRSLRREKPGNTPIATATVRDMLPEYARLPENLDLIGIPLNNWATVQDPMETLAYLNQRRLLTARSNPDALMWAMIDASAPPIYREAIWGRDRPPSWGVPQVQPEQLRIAAYAAISAGCRGLCFNADASLTQGPGRANLLELALLNEELDILEPILGDADKTIQMLETFPADQVIPVPPPVIGLNTSTTRVKIPNELPPNETIKAASFETKDRRGRLLLVADYAKYGQYQPTMAALNDLRIVVPASPDSVAYEITPGGVTVRSTERVPGGMRITLPDFGVSTVVLITTNLDLKNQIQAAINANRHLACAFAIEQAEIQRAWVEEIDARIVDLGHAEKDSDALIAKSGELIQSAREKYEAEDYTMAWEEARRAGRPLRLLMRYHFMDAYTRIVRSLNDEKLPCGPELVPIKDDEKDKDDEQDQGKEKDRYRKRIVQPIVCPPLASWSTLPQAWIWSDWIREGRLGANRLPSGDFESKVEDLLKGQGWVDEGYENEDLETLITINKGGADGKGRNLFLRARPKPGIPIDTLVPFLDEPVVAVRSPSFRVAEREVYRISMVVDFAYPTNPGVGGLIVRDSIGGERLQFRLTSAAQGWYEIVFYRRIPADGTMSLLIGLAGYGVVAVDDLKIEPIQERVNLEDYDSGRPPRPTPGTDARTSATTTRTRAVTRSQPYPIRQ